MAEVAAMRNNALPYPVWGLSFTVVIPILDADGDVVTSATGLDSEISKNGDTPADCTNEATEIGSSGQYYLTLTGTEMQADIISGVTKTSSSGAKTTCWTLYPRKLVAIATGTCQGSNDTGDIQLASGDSAVDDYYNGCLCVAVIDGTTEARIINDYVGSTKVGEVSPAWSTAAPDSSDTYTIYLPEGRQVAKADVVSANNVAITTTGAVDANITQISGDSTAADNLELMYDGTGYAGGTTKLGVSVAQWAATNVASPDTAGYPKVTIKGGTGTGELLLSSGQTAVGLLGSGLIVSSSFGAGAIDATSLNTTAVSKIATGVLPTGTIYVTTTGSDSNSGADWQAAKLTLAGAVSAVADGGRIVFGPGTFTTSASMASATKRVELCGQGMGVTILASTSSSTEMGIWLKGGSYIHDITINRTGYTGTVIAAVRIEGAGMVERVGIDSTCNGLWMYCNTAGDKQIVKDCCIRGAENGILFGGRTSGDNIHSYGMCVNNVVEVKDYTDCIASGILFQNSDGLIAECDVYATYPSSTATTLTGGTGGLPNMAYGIHAYEYSRVKVFGGRVRAGTLHASSGNHARGLASDSTSSLVASGVSITTFSATASPTALLDLYCESGSTLVIQDCEYSTSKVSGTVTASKGAVAPETLGRTIAATSTGTVPIHLTQDNGSDTVGEQLQNAGAATSSGGPIEQRPVAGSRVIQVRDRGDGTFGIIGNGIQMMPGERQMWALEFKGTLLSPGSTLYGMSEPDEDGTQAANLTVNDYGVDRTLAKAEMTLSGSAATTDDIEVDFTVQISATETVVVTVPVTVGS